MSWLKIAVFLVFILLIIPYYNGERSFLVKKDICLFSSQIVNVLDQIFSQFYRSASGEGNVRGAWIIKVR